MATRDLAVRIFGDSTDINKAFGEAGDGAAGLGSKFSAFATKATVVAGAVAAGVVVAKGFADAASDLSEAQNKANVIFGDGAEVVGVFAEEAAQSFGLSETAATDMAASFGGLLSAADVEGAALSAMSLDLVGLTADLGSFNNMASDDVAQKLLAGLGGEAEGLKSLNIFMNASAVSAKGMEMGLGDANGVMTEAEKIQARYALIVEGSSVAQGDFAATSDGLANSQKILGAEWDNMKAKLGEQLAPVFAEVFGYLGEVLPEIIDWLGPQMTAVGEALADFWDERGPAIMTIFGGIGSAVELMWTLVQPVLENFLKAVEFLIDAIALLVEGIERLDGLKDAVTGLVGGSGLEDLKSQAEFYESGGTYSARNGGSVGGPSSVVYQITDVSGAATQAALNEAGRAGFGRAG